MEYKEIIFRNEKGKDPKAYIKTITIKLQSNYKNFSVKVRRYSPSKYEFIKRKGKELESKRLVYRTNSIEWASALFLYQNPSPRIFGSLLILG